MSREIYENEAFVRSHEELIAASMLKILDRLIMELITTFKALESTNEKFGFLGRFKIHEMEMNDLKFKSGIPLANNYSGWAHFDGQRYLRDRLEELCDIVPLLVFARGCD
ncbi:hypothetical protein FQA39_LY01907 [Lamprigera yunnana]|nr:hypothetical protein FQA39_LY01907 [Lamprigera yunnana]